MRTLLVAAAAGEDGRREDLEKQTLFDTMTLHFINKTLLKLYTIQCQKVCYALDILSVRYFLTLYSVKKYLIREDRETPDQSGRRQPDAGCCEEADRKGGRRQRVVPWQVLPGGPRPAATSNLSKMQSLS